MVSELSSHIMDVKCSDKTRLIHCGSRSSAVEQRLNEFWSECVQYISATDVYRKRQAFRNLFYFGRYDFGFICRARSFKKEIVTCDQSVWFPPSERCEYDNLTKKDIYEHRWDMLCLVRVTFGLTPRKHSTQIQHRSARTWPDCFVIVSNCSLL